MVRWVSLVVLMLGCGSGVVAPPLPAGPRLDLNDVSFLVPLPAPSRLEAMLTARSAGAMGPLLPRHLFDGLPLLVPDQKAEALYGELRIVSVRVDPCFPGEAGACLKQVRLVAQPVFVDGDQLTTRDATVHLFYSLDDTLFARVVDALFLLDEQAGEMTAGALDVHPVLRRQGLDGPYHGRLKAMVLEGCGHATLSRVAFMSVDATGSLWRFGAFNVDRGMLAVDLIPRLPELSVQAVQEQGTAAFRSGALIPSAANDRLDTLLSERELRLADRHTVDAAVTSALRIEHPERSSPKTVDCASCHVASRALSHAEAALQLNSSQHPDRFLASEFDLRRVDEAGDDPRALRAFGYLGAKSAFSQRTINESAVVARRLEALRRAR